MTTSTSLSVVVPAFNEAGRISGTITAITSWFSAQSFACELRVVDDGSRDGTAEVVARLCADDQRIVLQREPHRGKGGAVRAGMLAARGERRFMCDADLSMPLDELARFVELVPSSFDLVVGSREGPGSKRIGEPGYRHIMGRVFNALVRRAAMLDVGDTQCGFKMFTGPAADAIFSRSTLDGWAFDVEVLTIARRLGLRVHELPIEWHYRDQSQVSAFRDSVLMARDVLKVRGNAMRGRYDR